MFLYYAITVLIGIINTRVIQTTRVPSEPLYELVHWATVDRDSRSRTMTSVDNGVTLLVE